MFNTVIHPDGELLYAVAGDPIIAHRRGCEWARPHFFQKIDRLYDVVIASCGGYPKDINLYQSVKTLQNASKMTKAGGHIIWVAQSGEGFANDVFQAWTEAATEPKQMIDRFYQSFTLGGHKAVYILEITQSKTVWLVTDMDAPSLKNLGLHTSNSLQFAVDQVEKKLASNTNQLFNISQSPLEVLLAPFAGFVHPE